jgi:hypothetical protein
MASSTRAKAPVRRHFIALDGGKLGADVFSSSRITLNLQTDIRCAGDR